MGGGIAKQIPNSPTSNEVDVNVVFKFNELTNVPTPEETDN
jgi:hypothetical protein